MLSLRADDWKQALAHHPGIMHKADRAAVLTTLCAPDSKARNERGQLGVNKLKAIGKPRWRRR